LAIYSFEIINHSFNNRAIYSYYNPIDFVNREGQKILIKIHILTHH